QRQIAQQPGTAVAADYLLNRTPEVDIDVVEAQILAIARGISHHLRIRTEELGGDGMLVGLEVQVSERPSRPDVFRCSHHAVRTGELGHQEPTSALGPD